MTKRRMITFVCALVVGAGFAVALPQLKAVSASSPPLAAAVTLSNTATLGAKGATATPTVTITCPSDAYVNATLQLNERSGNKIATGYANVPNVVCDGTPHDYQVQVAAQNAPFGPGTAFGQADLFVCDSGGCGTVTDAHNVKLAKH